MLLKTAEKHWYHVVCSCVMDWLWEIIDSGSERKICLAFIYFSSNNCYVLFMRFDLIMLTSLDSWLAFNDIYNNGRPVIDGAFCLFWIWSENYCPGYMLIQNIERENIVCMATTVIPATYLATDHFTFRDVYVLQPNQNKNQIISYLDMNKSVFLFSQILPNLWWNFRVIIFTFLNFTN